MTFAADLKAWIKRQGYTRNQAATALSVPRSTLDGWCAGRAPALEGLIRRLMTALERDSNK
jgi:transcriptional regulator with XRE-family HTH domain